MHVCGDDDGGGGGTCISSMYVACLNILAFFALSFCLCLCLCFRMLFTLLILQFYTLFSYTWTNSFPFGLAFIWNLVYLFRFFKWWKFLYIWANYYANIHIRTYMCAYLQAPAHTHTHQELGFDQKFNLIFWAYKMPLFISFVSFVFVQ